MDTARDSRCNSWGMMRTVSLFPLGVLVASLALAACDHGSKTVDRDGGETEMDGGAPPSDASCTSPDCECAADIDCDDGVPCTTESCSSGQCVITVVDVDGDGYGCIEDCDDEDPGVHPVAAEVCDGIDNDCDGTVDLAAPDTVTGDGTWYADCDGDGYAAAFAASTTGCEELPPPEPPTEHCGDAPAPQWTFRDPVKFTDCNDDVSDAYPGQTAWFATPIPGTMSDFDYNCDGISTRRWIYTKDECGGVTPCESVCMTCEGGWTDVVPDCGDEAPFTLCEANPDYCGSQPCSEPVCIGDAGDTLWTQPCH